jgi:MurNAc alpha-1-phosphate uridylyltransferase
VSELVGVVLAAGAGTRLRPLTELRPKALCPVGNVPLVDLGLRRLAPYVSRVAVNVHHHRDALVEHLRDVHLSIEEPLALGTAGALGRLRDWIDGRDVLLTNADSYLDGDLGPLVGGWDGERASLLTTTVPGRGDFGDQRYVGACLLPWAEVAQLSAEPSGLYEVMWRDRAAAGRLELVGFDGTAIDCGTPADYLAANLHATRGETLLGDGATVTGTVRRAVIGPGAVVAGRVTGSVVWPGCRVEAGEVLERVVRADGGLTVRA